MISALVICCLWFAAWLIDHRPPAYGWRFCLLAAVWWTALAVLALLPTGQVDLRLAVAEVAFAAWWAYLAWKRRPPRKRRPSRVAARVRDLGHRLVVTA